MKKFLQLVLVFLCFSSEVYSATKKRSVRKTNSKVNYAKPTQDQCNIDIDYCFNRYCFDKKTLNEGVYSKCGAEPASTILINVEDCLATRAVIKKLDLQAGCKSYSYNRIISLLDNKDVIEVGMKKNTKECAKATKALQAAKECYAAMISSDGSSSVELYNRLDKLCGFEASGDSYMLNRFYQAGDYGDSNVGALEDLRLSGQNTQKRENWRQIVDATLAGYTEIAELACGEEDYKLTKVNQYALDSRENTKMIALEAEAKEMGRQTANRIVNHWFRETDCINSPLPVGGLYWDYKKGRSPDCMLVCKEGYVLGRNSSTCVKEADDEQETFIGLNIGNDWIGETKKQQKKQEDKTPTPVPSVREDVVVSDTCTKEGKTKRTWSPSKGIAGVCEVFFPDCHSRYYCRHTGADGEYFVTGSSRGSYDSWYDMKLDNDNGQDLNTIFKTSFKRFGDEYKEHLSFYLKNKCLELCNSKGNGTTDECSSWKPTESVKSWKKNPTNGITPCFPLDCQSGYHHCDVEGRDCCKDESKGTTASSGECADVPEISTEDAVIHQWESFLSSHSLTNCVNNEKSRLTTLINSWYHPVRNGGASYGPGASDLERVMKQIKECACKSSTSTTTTVSGLCLEVPYPAIDEGNGSPELDAKWEEFLKKDFSICSSEKNDVINYWDAFKHGGTAYWSVEGKMKKLKNCICKSSTSMTTATKTVTKKYDEDVVSCSEQPATQFVKKWRDDPNSNSCLPSECQKGYVICNKGRSCCEI